MYALVIISCLAILVLYMGLWETTRKFLLPVSVIGLVGAFCAALSCWNSPASYYNNMMADDHFSIAFSAVMIGCTLLIMLLSKDYFETISKHVAEYYALILFSLAGGVVMVSFENLTMLFLGIEILSVSVYILAGIQKRNMLSNEASLKYFLMGAFFTAFLLLGFAFIYGATASFDVTKIAESINSGNAKTFLLHTGIILVMIALSFKVSVAPFHFWTPDVYDGAPTLVTTFMSTVVKIAGFAAFIHLFEAAFGTLNNFWASGIWILVVLTLFTGNIAALLQKSLKKMLAYSSISHAGYMLIAVLAGGAFTGGISLSPNAILIYAIGYSLATISAFGILIAVSKQTGSDDIDSLKGLWRKNPLLALVMTVSMCSLAGIPLTAGFFAKFYIFRTALEQHQVWIVVFGIINAIIAIYYYFKVIIAIYFTEETDTERIHVNSPFAFVLGLASVMTLVLGIYPSLFADFLN